MVTKRYEGRQRRNAETTRTDILTAAGTLFRRRGFDAVTMREIASAARCSHTAIYRYFADKEALLEALTAPTLDRMRREFEDIAERPITPEVRLQTMCLLFIRFSLEHRSMVHLLFTTGAERVDREPRRYGINRLRIRLFSKLRAAVGETLGLVQEDDRTLQYSRILYYLLHGIAGTYEDSAEDAIELMGRLEPTFRNAITVLVTGFRAEI